MVASTATAKRDRLNLRIKPEVRGLIDRAAQALGKSRTEFILEAATRAAEEALLDQTLVRVSPQAYADFLERLELPAVANERLQKTMHTQAPWD